MTTRCSTLVDAAAREIVARSGLDETLFVEAGAGTGKTTQLVARVVNLVCERGAPVSSIAAITFTEAAAAELRIRVREALERRAEGSEAGADRARAALDELDAATISTLHAFAHRLVASHPLALGMPPRIEVLDEVESRLERERRWGRFLDELYERPDAEALLTRALLLDVPIDSRHRTGLRQVAEELNGNWDRLDGLAAGPRTPRAVPWDRVEAHLEALRALRGRCHDTDDRLLVRVDEWLSHLEAITRSASEADRLELLDLAPSGKVTTCGRKDNWDDIDAARAAVSDASATLDELHDRAVDGVLMALSAEVAEHTREAAWERARGGRVEFHDLLVLARTLLRDHPDARRSLHERYRHILLDEFQDTDPIQVEIAVAIAAGPACARHWRDSVVPDGSLFFVGDPKQSIYRFRRADVALFADARDRFAPDGPVVLDQNFRTVPAVVDYVNATFGELMDSRDATDPPVYRPLGAVREGAPGVDHRPLLFGGPHDDDTRAADIRDAEAADVASLVAGIEREPDAWPVFDERVGDWRPARPGDVAVLVPTRTSLPALTARLDAAGVEHRAETGTLLYDADEVREVMAVLRAIDDPGDQVSVVAALRSPLLGVTDIELARWRVAGGELDDPSSGPARGPVADALQWLAGLRATRWYSSPSALLDRVLRERSAEALAWARARPAESRRRLRFLADQARMYVDTTGGDLRGFLDWARMQAADAARVHEATTDAGDDAVRIVTMHGAKGLEYPIVILSGLSTVRRRSPRGVGVFYGDDIRRPEVRLRGDRTTAGFDIWGDLEAQMDEEESVRLLYVAATRARDHLAVSVHHGAGRPSHGARLHGASSRESGVARHVSTVVPCRAPRRAPARVGDAAAVLAASRRDRVRWIRERDAATHTAGRSIAASALSGARDGGDGPGQGRGAAIGRAVHAVLQQADLAGPLDPVAVAAAARAEGVADATDRVAALARAAIDTPRVADAANRPHHREMYVSARIGDRLVEGFIDLLVETDRGLVIVDYKTDTVGPAGVDALAEAHATQLAAYAEATERVTGTPVVDAVLVLCAHDPPLAHPIDDLARRRRALVRDLSGSDATGPEPVATRG